MQEMLNQTAQLVAAYLPNLLGGLAILIIGWLIALVAAAITRGVLRRTKLGKRIARWMVGEEKADTFPVGRYLSRGVFYLIMLFVLVAFFQSLGLTPVTEPINNLLNEVFQYLPQLFGAAILLAIAWIVASVLKFVVSRFLTAIKLDERLSEKTDKPEGEALSLSNTLSNVLFWLVLLLFLPAILGALAMEGLMTPVQEMLGKILDFLPNIFIAGIILIIGWFLATIVRRIAENLLEAIGLNRFTEKIGLSKTLGDQKVSALIGLVIYVFILIPVLLAAFNALQLETITSPVSNMLNKILEAVPNIFAAALILILAYVVGRLLAGLVTGILTGFGFNKALEKIGIGKELVPGKQTASEILGSVVLIVIMLFAAIEALDLLGFVGVSQIVIEFTYFAGDVLLGLLLFALGLFLANYIAKKIAASGAAQANLWAPVARIAILFLAASMALNQMGFAAEIINLAFGLLLGAMGLALAIAFGWGGREAAGRYVEEFLQARKTKRTPKSKA